VCSAWPNGPRTQPKRGPDRDALAKDSGEKIHENSVFLASNCLKRSFEFSSFV